MRLTARIWLVAVVACIAAGSSSPGALAGEFGVAKFEAGTCKSDEPPAKECSYMAPESQFFTQAAGHPKFGITGFEVNTEATIGGKKPVGNVKDIRVDIPPGLSVNPQATCSKEELETNTCAGKGQCTPEQFKASSCPLASLVGTDELEAFIGLVQIGPLSLPMYDLVPSPGVPAEFGVELDPLGVAFAGIKVLIVGGVSWFKEEPTSENSGVLTGDYHEYFTIKEVPNTVGLVKTRLKFEGTAGNGTFITLPSTCTTQTSHLHVDSYEKPGEFLGYKTVSGEPPKAISVNGCEEVPFAPAVSLSAGVSEGGADQPDGAGVDVHVPQATSASELNNSDVKQVDVALPEGLTMNPSAAHGLQACTAAQIAIGTSHEVACPAASKLADVSIETPVLPPKALQGALYLGSPTGAPITGPPFTVYLAAESSRYGVGVRLQGEATPNLTTGQLTTTFKENPELPFEDVVVKLKGGPRAPLANPLLCAAAPTSRLTPYTTGTPSAVLVSSPFGPGGESHCPASAPFALSQSTKDQTPTAGAHTGFSLELGRSDGQQYLAGVHTVLPPGLVGTIPTVTLCGEPQAAKGECPAASKIGIAQVLVGAGPEPYPFTGEVFLTGPYNGAPYGMSIVVPSVAGPFDFGPVVTRAGISIDPHTARAIVTSALPTIVSGVPLRLRSVDVDVNRPNFLINPTNCATLSTDTILTSTLGATQSLSSPFQVANCGALAFAPRFSAFTNAKTSRRNGAALTVKVGYPSGAQANISSVFAQLPKQLPSRLSTLNKACPEATFNANPAACPAQSRVGTANVTTPVLPGKLTGPAYFVSHGGAAFPDLDIVLQSEGGVEVILVGTTNIAKGVTSSTFGSVPDVPVSSFELKLPTGLFSALTANGSLCAKPLAMPVTFTAQNGKVVRQNTHIAVAGCHRGARLKILSRRVRGHRVILTLKVPSSGRLSVGGRDFRRASKRVRKAGRVTISTQLSKAGLRALARDHRHHKRLKLRLKVVLAPAKGRHLFAFTTARFR